MPGKLVAVVSDSRPIRRQIARTMSAAAAEVAFLPAASAGWEGLARPPDLLVFDCDNEGAAGQLEACGTALDPVPVVLISMGPQQQGLLRLLERFEINNLLAKRGAIRAIFPALDERELLVTCEKVIRRDIFGIDKYIGSWGIVLQREVVRALADKGPVLVRFARYLQGLDVPRHLQPAMVTVAEEFILNAIVHAPHDANGKPRYEHLGPKHPIVLEPNEYVEVTYGCDGQHLMVSVADNFGRLARKTLFEYLSRGLAGELQVEEKTSGAGLGLSLSATSIHQLIFNVQECVRTEAIAGWDLRANSVGEFRQLGRSLNVFWLPREGDRA